MAVVVSLPDPAVTGVNGARTRRLRRWRGLAHWADLVWQRIRQRP